MHRSILIDASHWGTSQPTGVERYVDSLMPELFAHLIKASFDRIHVVGYGENPPLALPKSVEWHSAPIQKFWGQRTLHTLQQRLKPSVFFTPSGIPPLQSSVPTVFTVHDLSFYHSPESYRLNQHLRLRGMSQFAARRAATLCVPSEFVKKDLVKRWHLNVDKIFVTPLALPILEEHAPQQPKWLSSTRYMLYVGRIERKKNLLTILAAFSQVETPFDLKLVLAGKDGVGAHEIRAFIKMLPKHVQEQILFPGYVTDSEKQWLYEHAELALVPSPYEGFGLPVLEGFSAQVPVICSSDGGSAEVAGDAALRVVFDDTDAWQKAMYTGIHDRTLRKELRYAGIQRLAHFTWSLTAQTTAAASAAALTL